MDLDRIKVTNLQDRERIIKAVKEKYPIGLDIHGFTILDYEFNWDTKRYKSIKYFYEKHKCKHFYNSCTVKFKIQCKRCGVEKFVTMRSLHSKSNTCRKCSNAIFNKIYKKRSIDGNNTKAKNLLECPFNHIYFSTVRDGFYVFYLKTPQKIYKKQSKNLNILLQYRKDLMTNLNKKIYINMITNDLKVCIKNEEIVNKFKENILYLSRLDNISSTIYHKLTVEED